MHTNNPGIIILTNNIVKTTKVKKWLDKNKPESFTVKYLDPIPADFKEVEKGLQALIDQEQGIVKTKEQQIFPEQRPYTHTYRVNQNTVLVAYSQEDLDKLKKNWNIN